MRKFLFLILLTLLPATAQARPRDDVMSGAYRCAPVANSRQWLDCYYGAAQPQRAGLGLAPALAGQIQLAASPPVGGAIPDEEIRSQVMVAASRCYPIGGDRQWLDCYYAAARPMRVSLGLQAPPAAPTYVEASNPAPARPVARSKKMVAQVQSFTFDRQRNFTVTLANGETWRQVSGDTNTAHWDKAPGSYTAIISPGFLGSTNLQIKGEPQIFKVQQVR